MRSLKQKIIIALMILATVLSIAYNRHEKRSERQDLASKVFSVTGPDFFKYIDGIDLNRPVRMYPINTGDLFIQYQVPGAPQGNFYGLFGSTPDELGISSVGFDFKNNRIVDKEMLMYEATRRMDVLSSYAAPVKDDWSTKEIETQTKGSALQLFSDCKPCFVLVENGKQTP